MCQLDKERDPTQVLHHLQLIQLETTLATLLSTTGSCLKSTTAEGWLAPVCFANTSVYEIQARISSWVYLQHLRRCEVSRIANLLIR
jgi:hypothetical protein